MLETCNDQIATSDSVMNTIATENRLGSQYSVIRRNGKRTPFDQNKITIALTKAFLAVEGGQASASRRVHQIVAKLCEQVVDALLKRLPENGVIHIEDIQDQVELALMRSGEHKVARAYVLYREEHEKQRLAEKAVQDGQTEQVEEPGLTIVNPDGAEVNFDPESLSATIEAATAGIEDVSSEKLFELTRESLFDGMKLSDLNQAMVLSARSLIDQEPNYSQVAARLLLSNLRLEALSFVNDSSTIVAQSEMAQVYPNYFIKYIKKASELKLLDEELTRFDLEKLAAAIQPDRDLAFNYLGLQTLYDRYFIHSENTRIELPQAFFMRVAMGLAINEIEREAKAVEFYQLLASFDFMSSTPTLFNSGTTRPQLSSCYLTTVPDNLYGIYDSLRDNAMLSKFAGGLGNDWTRVRGMGAWIKGTNGKSQGVVPFLKVANDTAVAVNQGGKRKGAVCAYLESWHIDVEDFLDLRKNTGDERRRAHDMNTANWIPDLFMQRVVEEKEWTLFSPDEVPELHELCGKAFAQAYEDYERKADAGEIRSFKRIKAVDLWRKMLGMLFETGHPWVTFKDPCNIRYTNQHQGVVHSSNLCTEITLHTNDDEIAVCNLGSVNLAQHITQGELDRAKLERTISTAMRMLDNVIEYNYYSVPQARNSNLKHRPVGLGVMGFQDALYQKEIAYASDAAVEFADRSMELISYLAIKASCQLAKERGSYSTFQGSLWSQGILPIDSAANLASERGNYINQDLSQTLAWDELREEIKSHGIRNSNCLAIAPTATISNICGVSQSIEPTYQNLYVKSNLSGEFSVSNPYLIKQLKKLNIWDEVMVNDLKYFDGSVQSIDRVPDTLKAIYATAFELDARWLVEAGSRRQKWIDQAQSLNLYMAEASGKKLDQLYKLAWVRGLKTTYYLRSLGATQVEKSTPEKYDAKPEPAPQVCSILDPDCEACQ
ncbi:ribonucleoside-diphosphate reductase subunit alpha [Aliikangiella coralliicola]|uniref:Ribonucleoside-diphosphate reductase n=1 Tax=Aliikangiella coralliicola TaxID=2592383 RepID=A0A545UFD5_9GAMM|nr:ribonucleoside-diphosphate reductase subunit alpha [Aliikangiella coralliicola]TQV88182.1 ribonucleoside-diphosphate reductase subunit alpha [Aliikangiella coralliicola]